MVSHTINNSERGTAILEFTLTAAFFFMMLVAVVAGGHLFWTHNALVEVTRRGARYAANQCKPNLAGCTNSSTTVERVKNVVLYSTSTAGTTPMVDNLEASNVTVSYSNDFGVASGTVSVKIENYQYKFFGINRIMPPYQTTVTGESAGFVAGGPLCP
jgi:Flp pilus assembly protein TadG